MSVIINLLHDYLYPNHDGDFLMHYGVSIDDGAPGPGSGRYPKGSGENPFQHDGSLIAEIRSLRKQGLTDKDIAERVCIYDKYGKPSAKALQRRYSVLQEQEKTAKIVKAKALQSEGKTVAEISSLMDAPWSTVKGWLGSEDANMSQNAKAAKLLRDLADEKKYVDVSAGSELWLGITKNRMENAEAILMEEGYSVNTIKVPQLGTNHMTTLSVLTPPGIQYSDVVENRFNISPVFDETRILNQGEVVSLGLTRDKIHSISSDRVMINYNEEGGIESDGLIEIRRGVDDISMGANRYCQVRIPVDDTHYIKGMAVYSDDLPDGIDVRFNTNKHMDKEKLDVLKPMKTLDDGTVDWDNPFGASITAIKEYTDKDGKKQYSATCIVNEEGTWQKWDRNIPAQLGSKQPVETIKRQLNLDLADARDEYDRICSLTDNVLKRKLLIEFADGCDQAAADLKAAPFPGQQTHVILPSSKVKDGEIYAPNYDDGTKVACVRYPYAYNGEMNILTVRNTGSPAAEMIGKNAPDAVVLNYKAAQRMSGADFDGDTVSVIPLSSKVKLVNQKPLAELDGFDPSEAYPGYKGMKVISSQGKQTEMGKVTNLITDMTLKNANDSDLAKAVKHSMVIIDSEKHELDYKRSEIENDIKELKKKYQDTGDGKTGAGTIISRAGAETNIYERKAWRAAKNSIDPETGEKIFTETGATYTKVKLKGEKVRDPETGKLKTVYPEGADEHGWVGTYIDYKNGNKMYYSTKSDSGKNVRHYITDDDITNSKIERRTQTIDRMLTVSDAYQLTSGGSKEHPGYKHEQVYAEYANSRKALANQARLEWLRTDEGKKDPAAAKKYEAEVKSLEAKLNVAERYAPLERQAQLMANRRMERLRAANPDMTKDREKKYKTQSINQARNALGVHRGESLIDISDREWEAIQAHSIAPTKLRRIYNNTDSEKLKERATPRTSSHKVTDNMKALAKNMAAIGYTNAQIADRLGISATSVSRALNE